MLRVLIIPTMLVSGCVTATPNSADAICDGTRQARADHAAALVRDGGPLSLVTGQVLISKIDAGCAG